MKVIKRDGTEQALDLKKILQRISKLADLQDPQLGLKQLKGVNCDALCIEIISNLYDGISSIEIDEISARIAAAKIEHPDYNSLAARIAVSNIQKNAPISFSKAMEILYDDTDSMSLIDDKVMRAVRKNKQKLNRAISHTNDYLFDFFGVKTLEKSYLLKKINVATKKSSIIETPQFMLMRVALGLHNSGGSTNVDDAIESYNVFKDLLMTHASPTLFNSGTKRQQNSSCFLMTMEDDLTSIMKTISDCAHISKYAGGIGINIGDIRAKGSIIKSTNGVTDGIVPLLQTINSITRYINQCFTPDTWVYSKQGPKQMGNITTDDYLVTIDGSFKKVNEVIESQVSKEILEITTNNTMYPVKVTKEHEIYLIKGQKETKNYSRILQDLKAGVIRPDFYSAGQLTTSDFVGYPVSYCEMKTDDYFEWNGLRWTKVKSVNKIQYSGPVLDFNMIDNHNYLTDMGLVHNSGKRKGSAAVYLPTFHADILEFLDLRKNTGDENMRARDLFFALWVSDYFMECVENDLDWYLLSPDECPGLTDAYGDAHKELHQRFVAEGKTREILKARDIWSKIIVSQIETGMPYILFGDSVNKKNNQANLGTIKNSNLCVAPETMVLTSKGYYPIKDLEDSDIEIWNGQEFTKTKVTKTGVNQELLKVKLSNGSEIECTPYHKFYVVTGKRPSSHPVLRKIEAKYLTKNMKIIKSDFPVIKNGSDDFPFPYEHGIFTADGTLENKMSTVFQCNYKALDGECYCGFHIKMYKEDGTDIPTIFCKALVGKGNPRITLYGEKKKLVKYLSTRLEVLPENSCKTLVVRLPMELKPKFTVPLNCNIDIKLRWLEGLSDGDGCVCKSAGTTAIQIISIHKEFLENVKYLLQTLSCDPKILIMHKEGQQLLPNQKGQNELYQCQTSYRLLLTSWDVAKLYELGFRPKRLQITGEYPRKNTKHFTMVEDIIKTNRVSDTYCFKEEKRGMGVFNGVLTGQCAEVLLHSSKDEIAVCNIATMSLPKFVDTNIETGEKFFNHAKLGAVVEIAVANLNKVIDVNFYPVPETEKNNKKNRPIIVGNQGLQNCFFELNLPFESKEAKELNSRIYETIQYYSIKKSNELAKIHGAYSTFEGSPASKGEFQHNMWGVDNKDLTYDWDSLKEKVMEFGLRNSMLTASPPTASTSQILGNFESFEPITNNFFTRNTLSGDFPIVNKYLVNDLISLGIWDTKMKDQIIHAQGSIQGIPEIPDNLKKLYKTVWEIPQRVLIDMSRDRGIFTDHTQSLNLYVTAPSIAKISSMLFHCWKSGLKTGVYYTRTKSIAQPIQFTVSKENVKKITEKDTADLYCSIDNKEACESCSG